MITLGVCYLKYDEIASVADSFLRKHKHTSFPVNIEHLIESVYPGTDLIPFPNLQTNYDTEGFSRPDFSAIYVDEYVWQHNENRYRFTLAHELGHKLMHKKYMRDLRYSSVTEWIQLLEDIDAGDHSRMEYQAYCFAGLLLVPPSHLKTEFRAELRSLDPQFNQARQSGLMRRDYIRYALNQVAENLSPRFRVSVDVITRRIQYDCLEELIL